MFDHPVNEGTLTEPTHTELLPRDEPKLLPVMVTVRLGCTWRGDTDVIRGGLVISKRTALLVPSAVRTVTLPERILVGTRNRIIVFDQAVNEETLTEPTHTELLPRDEPKLLP